MTAYDKMYVVLPWRIAEDLFIHIIRNYGIGWCEFRGGMGCTATECFNTRTIIVNDLPGGIVQMDVDDWLLNHGRLGYLRPWIEPSEWPREEYILTVDELRQVLEEE